LAPDVLALVTGAGGFLGRALVRALVARGDRVRALVRRPAAGLERPGVEVALGDATDPATLAATLRGAELVYHLAGVRRAADRTEFDRVNVQGTRRLLDACLAAPPGLRRLVLAGSRAASPPSAEPIDEAVAPAPAEWYGESKAEAERLVLAERHRLPVTVARPPRIMGPGDLENLFFFRVARSGWALRFTGGERPLSWVDVDDCARGLLLLGDRPEALGEPFFLTSEEPTSVEGLQLAAAAALGVRPRRLLVPAAALAGAGALADLLTRLTGRSFPVNAKLARQVLAPGWRCSGARARERLGFVAGTSLADSMGRAATWYRAEGLL
jgi:nucleoside-diphosphate-sugar epimerase